MERKQLDSGQYNRAGHIDRSLLAHGQYMKPEYFDRRLLDENFLRRKQPTILLTGPSAVGKGSLVSALVEGNEVAKILRHTSRSKGENEIEGQDYCFVSNSEFEEMVLRGELIEWGYYGPGYYGTSISEINKWSRFGGALIIDLDIDALSIIKSIFTSEGLNVMDVMLIPCPLPELNGERGIQGALEILQRRMRLRNRGEDEEDVKGRLNKAQLILERYEEVEHIIVNADDNLEKTIVNIRELTIRTMGLNSKGYNLQEF